MHTIFVVDGDSAGRMVMKAMLEEACFSVVTATSKRDAWEKTVGVSFTCSLVLIDADALGIANAISLIKSLRRMQKLRVTPILVLSDDLNQGRTEKFVRDAGATGFLEKPVDPNRLVEVVKKLARY